MSKSVALFFLLLIISVGCSDEFIADQVGDVYSAGTLSCY